MDPFASPDDLAEWPLPVPVDPGQAGVLLNYASALLRARVPGLDERVAAGTLDPQLPRLAVIQMVGRVLRNPEGLRSYTDTTGPFAESKSFDVDEASGRLAVTAEDLGLVTLDAGARVRNMQLRPGLL